ncbi:inorganic phosphate transporter [Alicyclobacillus fastidiosus]|uniref:Inorganic phosphate transporter n=1 Tax=Alicyclobacillus fastidiosus TaxID=392011 RepID=A0ABV5AC98_9BACL|nr:inorganic phosphate transporter [Alicyclobacillus fastidiosus]WEH11405.1 inorganic phosphate transporter [Alicyclobacillus fastidiosus]
MLIIAWIIALFFAANIGASGTAASMGAAYGAGAIRRRWIALVLVAAAAFLGAVVGGGSVVKTISGGIVPSHDITVEITVLILASACLTLFISNLIGVPLSTSEVTVGAVVGVGLAIGHVYGAKLAFIVSVWLIMPFVAMGIAYLLGKLIRVLEPKLSNVSAAARYTTLALTVLLVLSGCYEAFSAGMNNVANAIGPLVAANVIGVHAGLVFGALFVAIGAMTLGGKVLETNAKKITQLSILQGTAVSLTSATLVLVASLFGLPVPQTQATTMAIFGVGQSKVGRDIWRQDVVKRIVKIWIASPVSSLLLSYVLVELVTNRNLSALWVVAAVIVFAGLLWTFRRMRARQTSVAQRKSL